MYAKPRYHKAMKIQRTFKVRIYPASEGFAVAGIGMGASYAPDKA
jgi:hypothetical protein